jgi:exodeoxyribonuclease V gamma subunit
MRLYRSHRTEDLAAELGRVLETPRGLPLSPEVVVVQSRGMARWLSMALATRSGVCANVRFEFPGKVLAALTDAPDAASGFSPAALRWRLLRVLPGLLASPAFASLRPDCAALLAGAPIDRRALSLATRLADLYDRYLTWRPEMVIAWEAGELDAGGATGRDAWQSLLWRALVASVPEAARGHLARRARTPAVTAPWPRLCFFGMASLPPLYLDALAAADDRLEVHLFVPVPFTQFAHGLAGPAQLLRARARSASGADHLEEGHPLVVGPGRLAMEFQTLLEERVSVFDEREPEREPEPEPEPEPTADDASLLARLQREIVELALPTAWDRPPAAWAADDSVCVHACHSPMRQVEVLRDDLQALLAAHPALALHDVVVLTPDIERYAPLIEAVFGDPEATPHLPFRIADRPPRAGNPWASAILGVLALGEGRWPVSAVLDLLGLVPLQRRYDLDNSRLAAIEHLLREAGVAWGQDAAHRVREGLPDDAQNTWRFGLDRLLLGLALPDEGAEAFGGALPVPGVEGSVLTALGAFVEAWTTLEHHLGALTTPQPLAAWRTAIEHLLSAWAGPGAADEGLVAVRAALDALGEEAAIHDAEGAQPWALDAVRALLSGRLDDAAAAEGEAGFLTGGLTFCALVPMRSIPFPVVYLLGMDEGAFPRNPARPAYDLMARARRPGDRAPRDDDRHLFLEAVLSARRHLRILYTGFDVRTNASRPPSVAVDELLDVLGRMGQPVPLRVRGHTLQAFSPRAFGRGDDGAAVPPWGFDAAAYEGACALSAPPVPPRPFLGAALPPSAPEVVALGDLAAFYEGPVSWFVRQRLGVRLTDAATEAGNGDREPLELDGLARWRVRDHLLAEMRAGREPAVARWRTRGTGMLPLGTPGDVVLTQQAAVAGAVAEAAAAAAQGDRLPAVRVEVVVDGVRVVGSIGDLFPGGRVLARAGSIRGRLLASAWVTHVFWALAGVGGRTHLVGVSDDAAARWTFEPPEAPRVLATHLLAGYRSGRERPLRLFPETSLALVRAHREAAADGLPPDARMARAWHAAHDAWAGTFGAAGECETPAVSRIFGPVPLTTIDEVPPALPAAADEGFETLAFAFFGPLFAASVVP